MVAVLGPGLGFRVVPKPRGRQKGCYQGFDLLFFKWRFSELGVVGFSGNLVGRVGALSAILTVSGATRRYSCPAFMGLRSGPL